MRVSTNNYQDFANLCAAIGVTAVFSWAVSPTDFRVYAANGCGDWASWPASGTQAEPATFVADFPRAITLSAGLGINP